MKLIRKQYERPFIVEPTKLTRLLDGMHERLDEHPGQLRDYFEVFLTGNRTEETNSLDELFSIENTNRHNVRRLLVTSSKSDASQIPQHQIEVDFDGLERGKPKSIIAVRSDASGWASRVLSEVEEQVERTRTQDLGARGAALALLVLFLFIGLFGVVAAIAPVQRSQSILGWMWLKDKDLEWVRGILPKEGFLSEEQVREVTTRQLRNLVEDMPPEPRRITIRGIFVVVPFLVLAGAVAFLVFACYPGAVFLRGRWSGTIRTSKATA